MININPIDTIDISYLHCQYEGCSPYDKMTELMVLMQVGACRALT